METAYEQHLSEDEFGDHADDASLTPLDVPAAVPPPPPPSAPRHPRHAADASQHGPPLPTNSAAGRGAAASHPQFYINPAFTGYSRSPPRPPDHPHHSDGSYRSPLQPHQFDRLEKAEDFPIWEKRVRSHISSIPGYAEQLLDPDARPDHQRQEIIFNFLIQTVRDTDGFEKLSTIEGEGIEPGATSTRGRHAWKVLKEHYQQVGSIRLHELLTSFMKPQQPHENGSAFVTRVINRRLEIRRAGTPISEEQAKAVPPEGLRKEYQPYISDLHTGQEWIPLDVLQSRLIQACARVERQQRAAAESDSLSAHFGSALDGLG